MESFSILISVTVCISVCARFYLNREFSGIFIILGSIRFSIIWCSSNCLSCGNCKSDCFCIRDSSCGKDMSCSWEPISCYIIICNGSIIVSGSIFCFYGKVIAEINLVPGCNFTWIISTFHNINFSGCVRCKINLYCRFPTGISCRDNCKGYFIIAACYICRSCVSRTTYSSFVACYGVRCRMSICGTSCICNVADYGTKIYALALFNRLDRWFCGTNSSWFGKRYDIASTYSHFGCV